MASITEILTKIRQGDLDRILLDLYGADLLEMQRERYYSAVLQFGRYFGPAEDVRLYSVPGRTELCGNHTDHQNGVGLAAAVNRDIIAVVAARTNSLVRVKSYGFDKLDVVDLQIASPQAGESTHSASLIRGIGNALQKRNGTIGGFDAYTTSEVLRGSGLSSSAAFETMIGTILNDLYNGMRFSPLDIARASQYAENTYFGKPSGLLDPLACAVGGMLCVDLKQPETPHICKVEKVPLAQEFALCVTDTRGSHSELTKEFAAVREEMESVARFFGCDNLRQTTEQNLWKHFSQVRKACGDRAVLRALHFYKECDRAKQAYRYLSQGDAKGFLRCISESGHSAAQYNQNAFCDIREQAIPIALAVAQSILRGKGACRLQGSGFAGTIQAFVPKDMLPEYIRQMERVFASGCCVIMQVRKAGAMRVL